MASLSGIGPELNCSLPLDLSSPTNLAKLRKILYKKTRASKMCQLGKAGDAVASLPLAGHEVPPDLSLPDGFTPPPGLECSNCSDAATCRTTDGLGSDGCVELGAGSTTDSGLSDREETEPEVEEFQVKADAAMWTLALQSIEFHKRILSPVPPDLSLPDGFKPPPRLAPPPGHEYKNCSEAATCRTTDGLGNDGCVDLGAGCTTGSGLSDREGTEPEVEEVQVKVDAAMCTLSLQAIEFCKMIRSPVPPDLSLPDGLTPPLRLAPPPGLECSNCSDDLGSDGCIDFGARSTTGSGLSDREETDPEVEEFQMKADAAMMQLQSIEFCRMIRSPNKPVVTVDCPDTRISLNADALPFVPSFLSESPQTKPKANKVHRNANAPCFAPGQPEVPGRSGSFLALAQREGWLDSKLKTPIQSPLRKVVIEDTYSMSPSKSPYKATGMKRTAEHRRHLAPVMKIGVNFSV